MPQSKITISNIYFYIISERINFEQSFDIPNSYILEHFVQKLERLPNSNHLISEDTRDFREKGYSYANFSYLFKNRERVMSQKRAPRNVWATGS